MKKIRVYSPGTVANLVCGFDILGLALSAPNDIMELTLTEEPKVTIRNLDQFNLPTEPEKNVAGVVLLSIMRKQKNVLVSISALKTYQTRKRN
jgi:homoserine kinase